MRESCSPRSACTWKGPHRRRTAKAHRYEREVLRLTTYRPGVADPKAVACYSL